LILELLEQFLVVIVASPAGEDEKVLGFVPPGLEPIRARRDGAVKEPLKTDEGVGGRCHEE
jgi:hypothetical protein